MTYEAGSVDASIEFALTRALKIIPAHMKARDVAYMHRHAIVESIGDHLRLCGWVHRQNWAPLGTPKEPSNG